MTPTAGEILCGVILGLLLYLWTGFSRKEPLPPYLHDSDRPPPVRCDACGTPYPYWAKGHSHGLRLPTQDGSVCPGVFK